jgi:hypothetical protein
MVRRPAARLAPAARRRWSAVARLLLLALLLPLFLPLPVLAQDVLPPTGADTGTDTESSRTRFASFDVGFGVVLPEDAEVGISYGIGVDVANLLISGAAIRFGFRFWTSEDEQPDGRLVDIDDAILSIMVKKNVTLGRLDAYGGLGAGGHFISARFHQLEEEAEKRNGFRPGLEGILGLEFPVVDHGFVSLFAEGQGSLVSELSQLSLHVGVRIRFDRLGTGG